MKGKYWFITICSLLLLGCRKEQSQTSWLRGDWELVDYYHVDTNGMSKQFQNVSGKLELRGEKKSKQGTMTLKLTLENSDTASFTGEFLSVSADSVKYKFGNDLGYFHILKQTKKDIHWQGSLTNSPWDGMVWRKIN